MQRAARELAEVELMLRDLAAKAGLTRPPRLIPVIECGTAGAIATTDVSRNVIEIRRSLFRESDGVLASVLAHELRYLVYRHGAGMRFLRWTLLALAAAGGPIVWHTTHDLLAALCASTSPLWCWAVP